MASGAAQLSQRWRLRLDDEGKAADTGRMRAFAYLGLSALLMACGGEDFTSEPGGSDAGIGGSAGTGATGGGNAGQAGGGTGGASGGASGAPSGGAAGSGGAGGVVGPCAGDCVVVPKDWEGPVHRQVGAPCSGLYGKELLALNNGLNQSACELCSCTGSCRTGVQLYTLAGCTGSHVSAEAADGACVSLKQAAALSMQVSPIPSCTPTNPNPNPLPITWNASIAVCGSDAITSCADGKTCAPNADSVCVYRSGNFPCPSGWPNKNVDYKGVDDTRGCSNCTCAKNSGSCTVTGEMHSGSSCDSSSSASCTSKQGGSECCNVAASADKVRGKVESKNVVCAANGGQLNGSASPKDPYSVCCR